MKIQKATPADTDGVLCLIQDRIRWMDEQGLAQWNKFDYLEVFPPAYFLESIEDGNVYVAVEDGKIIGAVVLPETDAFWSDDTPALYIHHLVGARDARGVGRALLDFAECLARSRNIHVLRLDCQSTNSGLNDYYARLGFEPKGFCADGPYTGIKREKRL
ncbi:GNAT family N-acetyltransferase [Anaeromassilibacillus senegalensis]|uniref:GNAT family N-acetyltransferase n=1 Tax=Anaeromassilibacillus senegalensis TaxID=1673717 RepID=A0ABS9CPW3_9FIRM|nr:GNAT family N-acetyltransferase [Anaeromassilibacillus senegalensis]MCF2652673.1 GNAT family N-acetyltransferase [Anaeromassilibacillus senegalensis]